jgi:hypothetical protein
MSADWVPFCQCIKSMCKYVCQRREQQRGIIAQLLTFKKAWACAPNQIVVIKEEGKNKFSYPLFAK